MKTKSFITILFVLSMKIGFAQSWIYITSASDESKIYIKISSDYMPATLKVWIMKTEGKLTNNINGVEVLPGGATISLVEFDCLNQQFRIHLVGDLDPEGNIVNKQDFSGYKNPWYPILKDSVYEKVSQKACESSN